MQCSKVIFSFFFPDTKTEIKNTLTTEGQRIQTYLRCTSRSNRNRRNIGNLEMTPPNCSIGQLARNQRNEPHRTVHAQCGTGIKN